MSNRRRITNIVEQGFDALTRGALDAAADHLDRAEALAEGMGQADLLIVQPSLDALAELLADEHRKVRAARQAKGAFVVAGELVDA